MGEREPEDPGKVYWQKAVEDFGGVMPPPMVDHREAEARQAADYLTAWIKALNGGRLDAGEREVAREVAEAMARRLLPPPLLAVKDLAEAGRCPAWTDYGARRCRLPLDHAGDHDYVPENLKGGVPR